MQDDAELRYFDGRVWQALPERDNLISLGTAPVPTTIWQTLVYHVCHGLLMRYPLRDVLIWSWRNRKSFVEREAVEVEVSHV